MLPPAKQITKVPTPAMGATPFAGADGAFRQGVPVEGMSQRIVGMDLPVERAFALGLGSRLCGDNAGRRAVRRSMVPGEASSRARKAIGELVMETRRMSCASSRSSSHSNAAASSPGWSASSARAVSTT